MRIAVCNEEGMTKDCCAKMLEKLCKKVLLDARYKRYNKKEKLYRDLKKIHYDLIYLNFTGNLKETIQFLNRIRNLEKDTLLCLSTEYAKQISQAGDWEPMVCFKKPLLAKTFQKLLLTESKHKNDYFFEYQYKKRFYYVSVDDILYFESDGRKIIIHIRGGKTDYFLGKLGQIEERLVSDAQLFIRVHQSYLVNYRAIRRYGETEVLLSEQITLPVSKSRSEDAKKLYCRYRMERLKGGK